MLGHVFLNSLIIHEEKTKVWICDANYHKI